MVVLLPKSVLREIGKLPAVEAIPKFSHRARFFRIECERSGLFFSLIQFTEAVQDMVAF